MTDLFCTKVHHQVGFRKYLLRGLPAHKPHRVWQIAIFHQLQAFCPFRGAKGPSFRTRTPFLKIIKPNVETLRCPQEEMLMLSFRRYEVVIKSKPTKRKQLSLQVVKEDDKTKRHGIV